MSSLFVTMSFASLHCCYSAYTILICLKRTLLFAYIFLSGKVLSRHKAEVYQRHLRATVFATLS